MDTTLLTENSETSARSENNGIGGDVKVVCVPTRERGNEVKISNNVDFFISRKLDTRHVANS